MVSQCRYSLTVPLDLTPEVVDLLLLKVEVVVVLLPLQGSLGQALHVLGLLDLLAQVGHRGLEVAVEDKGSLQVGAGDIELPGDLRLGQVPPSPGVTPDDLRPDVPVNPVRMCEGPDLEEVIIALDPPAVFVPRSDVLPGRDNLLDRLPDLPVLLLAQVPPKRTVRYPQLVGHLPEGAATRG
jgi:hypothetical protein